MKHIIDSMEKTLYMLDLEITHNMEQVEQYKRNMESTANQILNLQLKKEEYMKAINVLKRSEYGVY